MVPVVQEIFGVHDHIKAVCRRFATAGWFAIAQELYSRQGNVAQLDNIQDVFNEHGVQIMSPHYLGDPAQAKVVAKADWYPAPAIQPVVKSGGA